MNKTFRVKYRRTRIYLPFNPRKGVCEVCGKRGKTDIHHYKYAYKTSEVKKNPLLALENSFEACFPCHRLANAVMLVLKYLEKVRVIKNLMKLKGVSLNGLDNNE